jgi:hypothetical protein
MRSNAKQCVTMEPMRMAGIIAARRAVLPYLPYLPLQPAPGVAGHGRVLVHWRFVDPAEGA